MALRAMVFVPNLSSNIQVSMHVIWTEHVRLFHHSESISSITLRSPGIATSRLTGGYRRLPLLAKVLPFFCFSSISFPHSTHHVNRLTPKHVNTSLLPTASITIQFAD